MEEDYPAVSSEVGLCIFEELPPEVSRHVVTSYLTLPTAFTVFCVCKMWNGYKSDALIKHLTCLMHDLAEDYEKPCDKEWKWVALSKLPFTSEHFTGIGTLTRVDGVYEGEFVNGKFQGSGLFKWKDAHYYGSWQDGLCWGYGVMSWNTSHKYEGFWKSGKQKGLGVFHFANGDKYDGMWKNGKRDGPGVFYWISGDRYEGEWKEGFRDGKGKFVWDNGDSYDGEWRLGARQGMGTLLWANGERYEGEWKDDDRTGQGSFYWSNGDIYEGEWKDSAQHGPGKLVWGNGNSFEGEWKSGNKFDGWLFEKPSGNKFYRCADEDNLEVDYQFVHPTVSNALKKDICSYTVTGPRCYFQYLFKTKDNDERTHGVCLACYQHCVPRHSLPLFSGKMFYGGNFYCDCGSGNLLATDGRAVRCLCLKH